MTNREKRVINAFKACIESGEFSPEYATILIENNTKYGWITDAAKDEFYEWLDAWKAKKWAEEIQERAKNATAEILDVEYEEGYDPEAQSGEESPVEESEELAEPDAGDGEPAEDPGDGEADAADAAGEAGEAGEDEADGQ